MLPKLTKMDLKMRPHSHRDPELVENRKHQIRTINTMVFEGSTFSENTKHHINFNQHLVWNTFGTHLASGAVKIAHRVDPSGASDVLWHEKGPKMDPQGVVFSGPFGSIFDLWLDFWLENSSMAPLEGFRVPKLTLKAPQLLPNVKKTPLKQDPGPFSGPWERSRGSN